MLNINVLVDGVIIRSTIPISVNMLKCMVDVIISALSANKQEETIGIAAIIMINKLSTNHYAAAKVVAA